MSAPSNERRRNSPRSMSGSRERLSMSTKLASRAAERTNETMMRGEPQPLFGPSLSAYSRATRPAATVSRPG